MKIFLILINHSYQEGIHYIDEDELLKFENKIKDVVSKFQIKWIGEEFSIDACKEKKINESTIKEIAREMNIIDEYCDPNKSERAILGIGEKDKNTFFKKKFETLGLAEAEKQQWKTEKEREMFEFPIREQFRLDKIELQKDNILLFVCGINHKETFIPLLENNGYEVEVVGAYR